MKTREEIVAKIKKLLRLAGSDNQGEAQNALRLAQKMMYENNIFDIDKEEEKESIVDIEIEESTQGLSIRRKQMAASMASHFRVFVYLRGGRRIHVVGYQNDVDLFISAFTYTYKVFEQCSKIFLKNTATLSRSHALALKNDYFCGFLSGLSEALTKNEQEHSLMVIVPEAVEEYKVEKLNLCKARPSKMKCSYDYTATAAGVRDGRNSQDGKNKLAC